MAGKIGFNWLFGAIGFIITFIVSFSNNILVTSVVRSCIAFVVWFVLAFALRWLLGFLTSPPAEPELPVMEAEQEEETDRGTVLDMTTPDESEELNDLLKQKPDAPSEPSGFSPLNPPKLVKTSEQDPEELAKALRHLTEK
ncbi:hypothetical protein [Paenibacillus sp. J22TS3]|uniref:hypothetical protein n=1 Tax=Paenibacillus sp. J22TS3 TaxID=2807192 RepID=UPI001B019F36|nr:hypothetical protein [Paenibacillus sp. J22TS3]GIP21450.1 hypothetical protein J22TS3_17250 [Paenibacillus sp. J22TS3]